MSNEVENKIRARAYELWEVGGCQTGRELEYWTRAEQEVLEAPIMAARAWPRRFRPQPSRKQPLVPAARPRWPRAFPVQIETT